MKDPPESPPDARRVGFKLLINLFTATGAGFSCFAIYAAYLGNERTAWVWMGLAMVVDWCDGSLVRYFDLEGVAPRYDGERLDEYADLLGYVVAPVCFAWFSGLVPGNALGLTTGLVVVGVSCIQFARTDNKTESAFWGWPSYWNVLYFYGWGLSLGPAWMVPTSLVLSLAALLPVPFAYPSRLPVLRRPTQLASVVWVILLAAYVLEPDLPRTWLALSLLYPLYYMVLSLTLYERLK